MLTRKFISHGGRVNSCTLLRTLHNKTRSLHHHHHNHQVKEIEIPVPWGKVAGRLWGSQDKQPMLAMHGWQDNAASFNALAPLICANTPVLAIDLPGHGLSSWLPPGIMYYEIVYFLLIERIKRYYGWKQVKIIAHSLSAMTSYWYAASFPTDLQYVIALDFFKFPSIGTSNHVSLFANAVQAFFKLEESNVEQRSYSESEIMRKFTDGFLTLDNVSCKMLMTRGVTRNDDGMYTINRDPKIRIVPVHCMFSQEQQECFAQLITCPYLILKGHDAPYVELKENVLNAMQIMKSSNENMHYEEVPGEHHFHLTHAESAAAIINPFLEKYDRVDG